MARAAVAEGDVAPLYVRVRSIYRQQGIATVLIATTGSAGGPGWEQRPVLLQSLGPPCAEIDVETSEWSSFVPRRFW